MAGALMKTDFFADLVGRIQQHQIITQSRYIPLDATRLGWSPAAGEWSILQCFDHLNETHDYYMERILPLLGQAPRQSGSRSSNGPLPIAAPSNPAEDVYQASLWGGMYMFFAFNPRFSFPAPADTRPQVQPDVQTLDIYLGKQQRLLQVLEEAEGLDLSRTRVPIKKGLSFNLGDCLKVLVYHDGLHMLQAAGVYAKLPERREGSGSYL